MPTSRSSPRDWSARPTSRSHRCVPTSSCRSCGAPTSSRSTAPTRPARCRGSEPNAETLVELVDTAGGLGLYRLTPRTGRTHQLRCQLWGLGIPIVGDPLYPVDRAVADDDFTESLQLLAAVLEFDDPVDGTPTALREPPQARRLARAVAGAVTRRATRDVHRPVPKLTALLRRAGVTGPV